MLYLHVTFRYEALNGNGTKCTFKGRLAQTAAGMHCCFNGDEDAAQPGDFHLSITEPSPGEPAISMLTSAMEMLQLLSDVSEWR